MSITLDKFCNNSLLFAASALVLAGCQTTGTGIGAAAGGVIGGAGCALLGGNNLECLAAAAAGAALGGVIGNELDKRDKERRNAAFAEATTTNEAVVWSNDETDNSGSIQTLNTYQDTQGRECKVYKESYVKNGQLIDDEYTVCTGADGQPDFL